MQRLLEVDAACKGEERRCGELLVSHVHDPAHVKITSHTARKPSLHAPGSGSASRGRARGAALAPRCCCRSLISCSGCCCSCCCAGRGNSRCCCCQDCCCHCCTGGRGSCCCCCSCCCCQDCCCRCCAGGGGSCCCCCHCWCCCHCCAGGSGCDCCCCGPKPCWKAACPASAPMDDAMPSSSQLPTCVRRMAEQRGCPPDAAAGMSARPGSPKPAAPVACAKAARKAGGGGAAPKQLQQPRQPVPPAAQGSVKPGGAGKGPQGAPQTPQGPNAGIGSRLRIPAAREWRQHGCAGSIQALKVWARRRDSGAAAAPAAAPHLQVRAEPRPRTLQQGQLQGQASRGREVGARGHSGRPAPHQGQQKA